MKSKIMINLKKRGFTLLELAIVMGVVGSLVTGLFQLVGTGTHQINNQVTAQQLQLLDKTTKAWLFATRSTATVAGDTINGVYYNIGDVKDVTAQVQTFRQNTLPLTAPNGGAYKISLYRGPDVAGQAYYIMLAAVIGGVKHQKADVGQISAYVGGEGAGIYPVNDGAVGVTTCTPASKQTIRGSFGAICVDLPTLTPAGVTYDTTVRPAALAFITLTDLGTTDQRFLWRVPAVSGSGLNDMTVDLGFQAARGINFAGAGNITMNGGKIAGVGTGGIAISNGPIATGGGTITTSGGQVRTNGGAISTAGASAATSGAITTGGGSIDSGGGNISTTNGSVQIGSGTLNFNSGAQSSSAYLSTITVDGTPKQALLFAISDVAIAGTLYANSLRATNFIYSSSFSTSDQRLKDNIAPLENSLDMILKIHGVSYRLKETGKESMGVIAQDVQKVYPQLVTKMNDSYMAVNYNGLIAPLIESIRTLKDQNDRLTARVDALEAQLNKKGDDR